MNLEEVKEHFKNCDTFRCTYLKSDICKYDPEKIIEHPVGYFYIENNLGVLCFLYGKIGAGKILTYKYELLCSEERVREIVKEMLEPTFATKDEKEALGRFHAFMLNRKNTEESELVPYTRREYEWRWVMKDCRDEMYISNAYFSQKYVGLVDSTIFVQKIESTKRIKKS